MVRCCCSVPPSALVVAVVIVVDSIVNTVNASKTNQLARQSELVKKDELDDGVGE